MLKNGVIELAEVELAAAIVLLRRRTVLRFYAHSKKLNAITVRHSFLIPRMEQCIDSLRDAPKFFTLDANSCYFEA